MGLPMLTSRRPELVRLEEPGGAEGERGHLSELCNLRQVLQKFETVTTFVLLLQHFVQL